MKEILFELIYNKLKYMYSMAAEYNFSRHIRGKAIDE